jgi:urease accessory protein
VARERFSLGAESAVLAAMRAQFAEPYYASCFVVSQEVGADAECWGRIHELHSAEAWVGCSALVRGGWAIRVMAEGSVVLRKVIAKVRGEIYTMLGSRPPALRRS